MRISMTMNDNQLLELIQGLVKIIRPVTADEVSFKNGLDTNLNETGLDSLDMIMMSVYLSELYGVPEEIAKTMSGDTTRTVRDMINFMEMHHTQELPATAAECLEQIK